MSDRPEAKVRRSISSRRRRKYAEALTLPTVAARLPTFGKRTKNLQRKLNALLRKEPGSKRMERDIARISSIIFGLCEDIKAKKISGVDLSDEIKQLNEAIISVVNRNKETYHQGLVPNNRKGETILGCYLNCMVTLTVHDEKMEFGKCPEFLRYPATDKPLEIDIILEDFNLAFEFQGEHHFTDPAVQRKDAFKVTAAGSNNVALIPVSIAQLSSVYILGATANFLTEFVGIRFHLTEEDLWFPTTIKYPLLQSYAKAIHRIYLAKTLFGPAFSWLDEQAQEYIFSRKKGNPHSATQPAPIYEGEPKLMRDLEWIYNRLGYVRRLRQLASN